MKGKPTNTPACIPPLYRTRKRRGTRRPLWPAHTPKRRRKCTPSCTVKRWRTWMPRREAVLLSLPGVRKHRKGCTRKMQHLRRCGNAVYPIQSVKTQEGRRRFVKNRQTAFSFLFFGAQGVPGELSPFSAQYGTGAAPLAPKPKHIGRGLCPMRGWKRFECVESSEPDLRPIWNRDFTRYGTETLPDMEQRLYPIWNRDFTRYGTETLPYMDQRLCPIWNRCCAFGFGSQNILGEGYARWVGGALWVHGRF